MTAETDQVLQLIDGKSRVTPLVGQFVSAGPAVWTVDTAGGRLTNCLPTSSYLPEVNEPVWLFFIDSTPYVLGPTMTKPSQGVVQALDGDFVLLDTSFGVVHVPYQGADPPVVGDIWKLYWNGGGIASGRMSTSPTPEAPPPAPEVPVTNHEDIFTALDAGSYGGGKWWSPQIWAADSSVGAWFYGSKIKDTLPASAQILTTEIYMSPEMVSGGSPNIAAHNSLTRPGGAPTFGASYPTPIGSQWVQLSNDIGNALKTGGSAGGVGVNHGGQSSFRSLAQDGQSGAIRIRSKY